MKLHSLDGYIQEILLAEYPDKLLLLDGCSRADVSVIKQFITQTLNRPISDLKVVVVTHMHPDHAGGANQLRKISGCKIACANNKSQWYSGIDGKLMHITDILLVRYVANKKQKKQRWLWYPSNLSADLHVNDKDKIPFFSDWQVLTTFGHTDRDISLHHIPSNVVYVADLIVAVKKGYTPPFPIFYPNQYKASLAKIAQLNATNIILAHGGKVNLSEHDFQQLIDKAPTTPMTHWRLIKTKLKQLVFGWDRITTIPD